MSEYLDLLLWLFLILIPVFYLGMPLLVRFQQRMAAHPRLTELDLHTLEPSIATFLTAQTRALFEFGFDEPTLVQIPSPAANVSAYLIMLVNRPSGDKAMVSVVAADRAGLRTSYVEYSTRFESGDVFNTLNSGELLPFPPAPQTFRTQVPTVTDPGQLYEIHKFVMQEHGPAGKKVVYEPDEALDYLARVCLIESYEKNVARGWMYYDSEGDCYRPTLRGAYRLTWGLMEPFKSMRKAAMLRRAKTVLEEFAWSRAS
jgi:hypothetical protein